MTSSLFGSDRTCSSVKTARGATHHFYNPTHTPTAPPSPPFRHPAVHSLNHPHHRYHPTTPTTPFRRTSYSYLMSELSPALQAEFCEDVSASRLNSVPFFFKRTVAFRLAVFKKLQCEVYAPREYVGRAHKHPSTPPQIPQHPHKYPSTLPQHPSAPAHSNPLPHHPTPTTHHQPNTPTPHHPN